MNHQSAPDSIGKWPRPLAFVLSGGGSWGASQVGMLAALEELGVVPDFVVGTSVGALNGAMVAIDPGSASHVLATVWAEIDRHTVFGGSRRKAAATLWKSRGAHLSAPTELVRLITHHTPIERLDDLAIPLFVVTTDAVTGAPYVIESGRLETALLASAAIPGVFPSVTIDGRRLVDGGVVANIPIRQALAKGAATTVVLDATPAQLTAKPPTRPIGQLLNTVSLMLRSQASADLEFVPSDRVVIQLPKVTPNGMSSFNFSRTQELIELGQRLTLLALEDGQA